MRLVPAARRRGGVSAGLRQAAVDEEEGEERAAARAWCAAPLPPPPLYIGQWVGQLDPPPSWGVGPKWGGNLPLKFPLSVVPPLGFPLGWPHGPRGAGAPGPSGPVRHPLVHVGPPGSVGATGGPSGTF